METKTRMKNKPTIKRLLANKCERERVRKINEAFEILKTHIPYCDSGRIRTKLDVLKFAIDYIQILTKMVSQSEAATLLKMTQLEKNAAFSLSTATSTTESPRTSNEMFPECLEGATAFPFGDQNSQLVSENSINVEHKNGTEIKYHVKKRSCFVQLDFLLIYHAVVVYMFNKVQYIGSLKVF